MTAEFVLFIAIIKLLIIIIIREVSLYVITYENPCVVRAGERGQLSYVLILHKMCYFARTRGSVFRVTNFHT